MNKVKNKTSYISIPNEILLNTDISNKAKYLYMILKSHAMNDSVIISPKKLKESLRWKYNPKLKKALEELKSKNYIYYDFDKIPIHNNMKINLLSAIPFTQIDRELFNKIKEYDFKHLILIYVLEYYYNAEWGYSCPSTSQINKVLKCNNKTLKSMIWTLHINYLCEYCQGKRKDNTSFERFRNRYIPNVIEYNKSDLDKLNERRYKIHKREEYFYSQENVSENYNTTIRDENTPF